MLPSAVFLAVLFTMFPTAHSINDIGICNNLTTTIDQRWKYSFANSTTDQTCYLELKISGSGIIALNIGASGLGKTDRMTIYNVYGDTVEVLDSYLYTYNFWPQPGVSIVFQIGDKSNASIYLDAVDRSVYKNSPVLRTNTTGSSALVVDGGTFVSSGTYIYTSQTRVSLSTLNIPIYTSNLGLLNLFLYDGEGTNATLVGSVYNTLNNNVFTSSGKSLTLYSNDNGDISGRLIINDYENVKQYSQLNTAWSNSFGPFIEKLEMSASDSAAALTVGADKASSQSLFLTGIAFTDPTAELLVYGGPPIADSSKLMLARYNASSYTQYLPQEFPAPIQTFVLTRGNATISTTSDLQLSQWNKAVVGRKGFIMSPGYPFSSNQQNINVTFGDDTASYAFHFDFQVATSSSNGSYVMDVTRRGTGVQTYSGKLQDQIYSVDGQSIRLSTIGSTAGANSTGEYVTFEITMARSASSWTGVLFLLLSTLYFY